MNPISIQIDTARLQLRAPQLSDARSLLAAIKPSLADLGSWLPWAAQPYGIEEVRRFLIDAHDAREMQYAYHFLLFQRDGLTPLGACSLHNIEPSVPRVEIGYWLALEARGQGLMTEAIAALSEVALQELGAYRVEINCDARNQSSARVARRAGFELEARLKNDRRDHFGGLADTLIFARIKEEK